ncbi:unnamed protein product [Durusdinium trenchii]|uniref:Uncharacterized protein n=1 Tax=Durusdinium trenchii TaxID=1381693 RepID=A0ABP0QZN8_9DINO
MAHSESEFSMVSVARDATDAATTRSPFELMKIGEEQENEYLRDAADRLSVDLWGPSVHDRIRALAEGSGPDVQTRLQDLTSSFQKVTCKRIFSMRLNIKNMAYTVFELLTREVQGDQEVPEKTCMKLEATRKQITAEIEKQLEDFSIRSKKHGQEVVTLMGEAKANFWHCALGLKGALAVGTCGAVVARLLYLASFRPERLAWTSFVNRWSKPSYKDPSGRIHYQRLTAEEGGIRLEARWALSFWCGIPVLAILFGGLGALWAYRSLCQKKVAETEADAHTLLKADIERHKRMWEGIHIAVHSVEHHFQTLQSLGEDQPLHRQETIKNLVRSLWAMRMGIDEICVWMKENGCFPPSYSVRNEIGHVLHDRIVSVFNQVKGKAGRQECAQIGVA